MASNNGYILADQKVANSGVETPLADDSILCTEIIIVAKAGNSSPIHIGGDDVHTNDNDGLVAGASLAFAVRAPYQRMLDLSAFYLLTTNNGDGVDIWATLA